MKASQFIDEITQAGNEIKIYNETITDCVDIRKDITAVGVFIENCVFEDDVVFEDADLNCGIKFINCVFKKYLAFNDCKTTKYNQRFNFYGHHIVFSNTKIYGLYFNGENNFERGVEITNKSEIKRLQVRTITSSNGSFSINDSTIESQFDVSNCRFSSDLSVRENSIINAKVRFEYNITGSILFTQSTFNKDIHIWSGKTDQLTFNDGVFCDDLYIHAVPILSRLTIIGAEFKKSINFTLQDKTNNKVGTLSKVYIQSSKFGDRLKVKGSNDQIDDLEIIASEQMEGTLYFNSMNILKAKLTGNNYGCNVTFDHCDFNKLLFDFFHNHSTLSIISACPFNSDSKITINHSHIGKTHFFNTSLNKFDKIVINNSVLIDIITANVEWFKDKNLNSDILPSSDSYTQKKEIYRQIKFALEKQGDRISSLQFKALEMKAFKKESFAKVPWYKKIINTDRFILWVGQTNNFGQTWLRPTGLAILFSLFFHFLIVIGISDKLAYWPVFSYDSMSITWDEYVKYFYVFPQLMNPTHFIKRVFPEESGLCTAVYFYDYLLKITLAFFIFQIVSAFRKYMK